MFHFPTPITTISSGVYNYMDFLPCGYLNVMPVLRFPLSYPYTCTPRHLVVLLCGDYDGSESLYEDILHEMKGKYQLTCMEQPWELADFHRKKTGHRVKETDPHHQTLDANYRAEYGDDICARVMCEQDWLDNFDGALFVTGADARDAQYFERFYSHVLVACVLPAKCEPSIQLDGVDVEDSTYRIRRTLEQRAVAIELVKRIARYYGELKHKGCFLYDGRFSDDDDTSDSGDEDE